MFVKFRQYIVKQQHRRILYDLPYQLDLRQFQRKCRCPLLSLRTKLADVDIVDEKCNIIPVRTGQRRLLFKILRSALANRRLEFLCPCIRVIDDSQGLLFPGQLSMNPQNQFVELTNEIFPVTNQLLTILNKLHIPNIKRLLVFRMKRKLLEQTVALHQNTVV